MVSETTQGQKKAIDMYPHGTKLQHKWALVNRWFSQGSLMGQIHIH